MSADSGPTSSTIVRAAMPGAWIALAILCLVNVLKNVDRVLIGVLAPSVKADFALTDFQVGMLSMAFAVAYAVCGVPIGRWADRSPRKLVITTVVCIWSLMTALCGVVPTRLWQSLCDRCDGARHFDRK